MTTVFVTLLLLVIGGFIAFAIYLQLKEQARIERLRKVALLNNQLRQERRFLDELPAQYQPKDMRLWLFSRILATCDELLAIQPDEPLARRRRFLQEEMVQFQSSKEKRRAKPVIDDVQILELKRLFDSFANYIHNAKTTKKIDQESAERYESLLMLYKYKVNADYHAYLARQSFLTHKMEEAVSEYQEAINQMRPIQEQPEAAEVIKKYEETIQEIEDDLELQRREAEMAAESQEDDEAEGELDDEWQKFMTDGEFQRKKHF
ncbi:hypothetical protein DN730_16330 [Marinomonas piezotolerans]|uniref:Uncharacterized protein n=1 Tax=Marinomonas piezotolerans TaxID=2213058 RepID=A0A370U5L2_9GAMM|nr:hypothetical protein [Marinomonas piezotolerans]RDL43067.1 hypothetical protein DN730_16330 [Marinomonas piezotolerans]